MTKSLIISDNVLAKFIGQKLVLSLQPFAAKAFRCRPFADGQIAICSPVAYRWAIN